MSKSPITLSRDEVVIAAVPERCSGPGWQNRLIWVHIKNYATNEIRQEAIQPEQQTPGMVSAFDVCAAAHSLMKLEVMKIT